MTYPKYEGHPVWFETQPASRSNLEIKACRGRTGNGASAPKLQVSGLFKGGPSRGNQVVLVTMETGESPHFDFGLDVSVAAGVGSVGCAKVVAD